MGEITIKIPNRKNRYYVFTDASQAEDLIEALDKSAVRVKANPAKLTLQQQEDFHDGRAADKALDDYHRSGISYTVDELREKYGLV